jgi:hypothetical protein
MIEDMSRLHMIGLTAPLFGCERRIWAIIVQVKIFVYFLRIDILSSLRNRQQKYIWKRSSRTFLKPI